MARALGRESHLESITRWDPSAAPWPPAHGPHPTLGMGHDAGRRGEGGSGSGFVNPAQVGRMVGAGSGSGRTGCAAGAQGLGGSCTVGTFVPVFRDIRHYTLCAGFVRLCTSDSPTTPPAHGGRPNRDTMSTTPTTPTDLPAEHWSDLTLHLAGAVALAVGDAIEGRKSVSDVMQVVVEYGSAMKALGAVLATHDG